jgi:DNA-binding MarR family transcriptional regulator
MTDIRWLDDRQQNAWRLFLHMHARLTARLHRELQSGAGLSHSDYAVLVALTDVSPTRVRIHELGVNLQWEKSRLSHQLRRMEQRGLVERQECPSDRRGAFIVLTDKGRQALQGAAGGHAEAVRQLVFDALTDEQVDSLTAISESVLAKLTDEQNPVPCAPAYLNGR